MPKQAARMNLANLDLIFVNMVLPPLLSFIKVNNRLASFAPTLPARRNHAGRR
jgi:hypothetical protein